MPPRAFLKMEERSAGRDCRFGPRSVSSRSGAARGARSQALLAHGLRVIGIDPAEVDPRVLAHPRFTHVRKRARKCAAASFAMSPGWPRI